MSSDGVEPGLRYLNRELSWLDFNDRVLAQAADPALGLLERAKFLAIFATNLDEFFQVRVAGLKDQLAAGVSARSHDGLTPSQQVLAARTMVVAATARLDALFAREVAPALADAGITLVRWTDLGPDDRAHLAGEFERRIFPVLTPLAVDPGHPFPYISNLSLNLAVVVQDPVNGDRRFARVKVPPLLPRFVSIGDGRWVLLEQVIAAHLAWLFPGMEVREAAPFRVTRNADLTLEEEEADDLLAQVELELRRRRFGRAVRLEVDASMTPETRHVLLRELDLDDEDLYEVEGPLDLSALWQWHDLDRPELKDEPHKPVTPPRLVVDDDTPADIFAVLRDGDLLVHHPYVSFSATVEEFVRQASRDPDVLAIKMTLYRTSGDSAIIKSLIRAVERGKQVVALVELKARFDEQANIAWAKALEEAGAHVVYGLVGLKTHSKTALVIRTEDEGVRRYCHVATGNYNPKTARIYEDVGVFTADPDVGADLTQLFNYLTGYGRPQAYRKLLVAPTGLRRGILALIEREIAAGPDQGRIVLKMNSLVDPRIIDGLYAASAAGVSVDLIVRGICCLRPGVPGLSDHIRVRSLVGRYLEHSRIYHFANGADDGGPVYLVGSADLMPRNLDKRVEVIVPVEEPSAQAYLAQVLATNLSDDSLAWTLDAEGRWSPVAELDGVDTHRRLQELAEGQARIPRD